MWLGLFSLITFIFVFLYIWCFGYYMFGKFIFWSCLFGVLYPPFSFRVIFFYDFVKNISALWLGVLPTSLSLLLKIWSLYSIPDVLDVLCPDFFLIYHFLLLIDLSITSTLSSNSLLHVFLICWGVLTLRFLFDNLSSQFQF